MKITRREVSALDDLYDEIATTGFSAKPRYKKVWHFFATHPHLLMPMGFDEYVGLSVIEEAPNRYWGQSSSSRPTFRIWTGQWVALSDVPVYGSKELTFHSRSTLLSDNEWNRSLPVVEFTANELRSRLHRVANQWTDEKRTIWSPQLWTPEAQDRERIALVNSTRDILKALHAEKISLRDVTWRQLEEIVAEVLRGHGMEIHVNRTHPQGGRDIIARGELIPGQEPLTIAVEVKHKELVDRPEVELALHQNKEFPALLFATSGRFTAGVLQEKKLPENQLRLFLKDGVALGDMISDHGRLMAQDARKSR